MNVRYLLLVIVAVLVIGAAFLYFVMPYLNPQNTNNTDAQTSGAFDPFGINGNNSGSGGKIPPVVVVENEAMKKVSSEVRQTTKEDLGIAKGYYDLGPDSTGASAAYDMYYWEADKSIQVILFEQPIGKTRRIAEDEILRRFNLTKDEACTLAYSVTVPLNVDDDYFGKNLGFSFCPGSAVLSEI